jgi:hypothetical protein
MNTKFIPVLFDGASQDDIPLPLKGFTRHHLDTPESYSDLYRRLTNQPSVTKPPLGRLKSLPVKNRAEYSLPTVFSLEQLSRTMSTPIMRMTSLGWTESTTGAPL